jgi:hypothetical protein
MGNTVTIEERLYGVTSWFYRETGKRPTKLFIGDSEYLELRASFHLGPQFRFSNASRARIADMDVYRVDADSLLTVSV